MSKKKVPELRFKGFTEDWEQRKLGDVTQITMGQSPSSENYTDNPEDYILVQGNADMKDGRVTPRVWTTQITKLAEKNDLLLSVRAPVGDIGKTDCNVVLGRGVAAIKGNEFIFQLLGKMKQDKYWTKLSTGSTFESINSKDIQEAVLMLPNRAEQKTIGEFFLILDNAIALHQRKLRQLESLKKGFLQMMFPEDGEKVPRLRFAHFSSDWDQRKLGEISNKVTEKNKENTFTETLTNSAEYGIINQREFFDKDISNEKNLNGYYIVREDDFVYNPRISNYAPVGPINRNKLGRTGVMSPLYYVFRTNDIDKSFLEYYFDSTIWHKFMKMNGDSGARADRFAIKDSVFKEMSIPYPELREQKITGEFLVRLINIITLHKKRISTFQELKKVFLQKMFV